MECFGLGNATKNEKPFIVKISYFISLCIITKLLGLEKRFKLVG